MKDFNPQVIYPPNTLMMQYTAVFLAGSIEMGKAIDWQQTIISGLHSYDGDA